MNKILLIATISVALLSGCSSPKRTNVQLNEQRAGNQIEKSDSIWCQEFNKKEQSYEKRGNVYYTKTCNGFGDWLFGPEEKEIKRGRMQ